MVLIFILQLLVISLEETYAFIQSTNSYTNRHEFASRTTDVSLQKGMQRKPSFLMGMPKAIIFDLDGCLWRPEMYELLWFSNGKGAPFQIDPEDPENLRTVGNEPVYLLGDVREVLSEIYNGVEFKGVKIGISSRTDEPDWARELLSKFTISTSEENKVAIEKVFNGPIEIAKDSKVEHFKRISKDTNIALEDMLFFDNEIGNCRVVSNLGVTVAYCPDGVTNELWSKVLTQEFPSESIIE